MRNASGVDPQPGDILLFYNSYGLGRFITTFTRSPFYHVALFAGGTELIEAGPKGVVRRDLRSREGGHQFVVVRAPEGKGPAALQWAHSKLGDGYDAKDLVIIALDRIFMHLHLNYAPGDRFTCGEFVASAFEQAGIRLFGDTKAADIVPADFAKLLAPHERRWVEQQKRARSRDGVIPRP